MPTVAKVPASVNEHGRTMGGFAGFVEIASDAQLDKESSITAHLRLGYQEVERSVCLLKRLRVSSK
jgi:hypothetical protein